MRGGNWVLSKTARGGQGRRRSALATATTIPSSTCRTFFRRYICATRSPWARDRCPSQLLLRVYVDDGAVVWINGTEVARVYAPPAGDPAYNDFGVNHEATWEEVIIPDPAGILVEGLNIMAIHALNTTLNSSDFSIDAELRTVPPQTLSSRPTPGRANSSRLANAPPQVRQVNHAPQQPRRTKRRRSRPRSPIPTGSGLSCWPIRLSRRGPISRRSWPSPRTSCGPIRILRSSRTPPMRAAG